MPATRTPVPIPPSHGTEIGIKVSFSSCVDFCGAFPPSRVRLPATSSIHDKEDAESSARLPLRERGQVLVRVLERDEQKPANRTTGEEPVGTRLPARVSRWPILAAERAWWIGRCQSSRRLRLFEPDNAAPGPAWLATETSGAAARAAGMQH